MAALSAQVRTELWADLMRRLSASNEPLGALTKAELKAVVDAADDWVEANKASFNSALPQSARTQLTSAQKARILAFIVQKRFDTGA